MRSEFHASHQIHFQFFLSQSTSSLRRLSGAGIYRKEWNLLIYFNAIFVYFFCEWITVNIAFTICFLHLQVDSISISISVHFFHFQSQSHCFRPDNSCRNLSIFHGANIIHTKKYAIHTTFLGIYSTFHFQLQPAVCIIYHSFSFAHLLADH